MIIIGIIFFPNAKRVLFFVLFFQFSLSFSPLKILWEKLPLVWWCLLIWIINDFSLWYAWHYQEYFLCPSFSIKNNLGQISWMSTFYLSGPIIYVIWICHQKRPKTGLNWQGDWADNWADQLLITLSFNKTWSFLSNIS